MGFFGAFKRQLKKRIRFKRRWLSLGVWVLALGGLVWYAASESHNPEPAVATLAGAPKETESAVNAGKASETILHTLYVCGEEFNSLGVLSPEDIRKTAKEHPNWEYVGVIDNKATFEVHVDDLSSECKLNSYIGIDALGNLTLYDGPPREERAVKTFYQLDVEHLESSLPGEVVEDLKRGIRIRDISEYNSVLSTFSDFAVDETEKVMKPQQ
jgi:forespore regulator of the sigma-K checkpoint